MSSGARSRGRIYMQWSIGILAILASFGLLLHAIGEYRGTSTTAAHGSLPAADLPKPPPNPAHLQYQSGSSTDSVFSNISHVDYYYQAAAAKWLLYRFHKIAVRGDNPGTISLETLRVATGTTPLPTSLASAGVRVPAGTPGLGSISLPNISDIPANPGVSSAERASLMTTAGEVALHYESNNPLSVMTYLDGPLMVSSGNSLAQQTAALKGALMQHISGVSHGLIPNAIHFYGTWAVASPDFRAKWIQPTVIKGQHVVAEIELLNPFEVDALASVNAGMTLAAVNVMPFQSLTLGLIDQSGQDRWYVVGLQTTNPPLHIKKALVASLTGGI